MTHHRVFRHYCVTCQSSFSYICRMYMEKNERKLFLLGFDGFATSHTRMDVHVCPSNGLSVNLSIGLRLLQGLEQQILDDHVLLATIWSSFYGFYSSKIAWYTLNTFHGEHLLHEICLTIFLLYWEKLVSKILISLFLVGHKNLQDTKALSSTEICLKT